MDMWCAWLCRWLMGSDAPSFLHVGEQPSPLTVLPSSHASPEPTIPSPQVPMSMGGVGAGWAVMAWHFGYG